MKKKIFILIVVALILIFFNFSCERLDYFLGDSGEFEKDAVSSALEGTENVAREETTSEETAVEEVEESQVDELVDEFDIKPTRYNSTDPYYFFLESSKAILYLDRGYSQVIFREIPETNDNFELIFKANIIESKGNCEMIVGLCDSNPSSGNIDNSVGVRFGYRVAGDGFPSSAFICSQWYIDGEETVAGLDNRIWVDLEEEYVIKLKVSSDSLELSAYDGNSRLDKIVSSYNPNTMRYPYFFIANFYSDGWETGYGYVDYMKITY